MAAPGAENVRIAFVSDTHVNMRTNAAKELYNRNMVQTIAAVNAARVDLVLITGDLTDNGLPEQMELFQKQIKRFKAPVIFVPGNHDVGHADKLGSPRTITPERLRLYEKKLGPGFFVRQKAGVRVVGVNALLFNTGFAEEQAQWRLLEKALAKPHRRPTLLLSHYPLFINSETEPEGIWNVDPANRQRLFALIKQGGVKAVLSGHTHRNIDHQRNGVRYLVNTATAYGIPIGKQKAGWELLHVSRQGDVQVELQTFE